jgi:hypothetical protein
LASDTRVALLQDDLHFYEAFLSISFLYLLRYFIVMKRKVTKQVSPASAVTVAADPVKAFRGSGKKGLVKQLLKDRRQDQQKEDALRK